MKHFFSRIAQHSILWPLFVIVVVALCITGIPSRNHVFLPADILGKIDAAYQNTSTRNPLLSDIIVQMYPWQKFLFERLHHGEIPLWNPYQLTGTPFLANDQSAIFDPVRLLAFVLGFSAAGSFWFMAFSRLVILGLGTYWWLRGKHAPSYALLGAALSIAATSSVAWLSYPLFAVIIWIPLMLRAIDELSSRPRFSMLVLAGSIAAQVFSGNIQILVFSLLFGLVYFFARTPRPTTSTSIRFGLGILFGLLLSAIQLFPTLQFIRQSSQFETGRHGYATENIFSALRHGKWIGWHSLSEARVGISSAFPLIAPNAFGSQVAHTYTFLDGDLNNNQNELAGSIGLLGFILAILGFYTTRRDRLTFAMGGVVLVSLGMIVHAPLFELLNYLPVVNVTSTGRLRFIIVFALIYLALLGLRAVHQKNITRRLSTSIFLVCMFVYGGIMLLAPKGRAWNIDIAITILSVGLFYFLSNTPRLLRWNSAVTLALFVGPLLVTLWSYNPSVSSSSVFPNTALISRLQHLTDSNHRFAVYSAESRTALAPNASMVFQLYDIRGYEVVRLRSSDALLRAMSQDGINLRRSISGYSSLLDVAAVSTVVIPTEEVDVIESFTSAGWKIDQALDDLTIVTNPTARTRAYFTTNVATAVGATQSQIVDEVRQHPSTTRIEAPLQIAHNVSEDNSVSIVAETANSISLKTNNTTAGYLVLNDAYDRGWVAMVDGHSQSILKANSAFRGLYLPAGQHEIQFTYRPIEWVVGIWVTVVALVGLLVYGLLPKRQII